MSSQVPSGDASATPSTAPAHAITYICRECRFESHIKPRENIRCRDCGHRVLIKKRTDMMSVFEAR